jgi:hypothetical protein
MKTGCPSSSAASRTAAIDRSAAESRRLTCEEIRARAVREN